MYVLLYLPEESDPEVFGAFPTPQRAVNILRRISNAAGKQIDVTHSALLATIDVTIDDERNRYQLLKVGSPDQLAVHADVIEEISGSARISVDTRPEPAKPARLSGY